MAQVKKFSPMRYTASTEEAAVQCAIQIVGAEREDVEYEVIDQSDKGVTVRIRPRAEEVASHSPIAQPVAEIEPETAPELEAQPEPEPIDDVMEPVSEMPIDEEADDEAEDEAPIEFEPETVPEPKEYPPIDPETADRAQTIAQGFLDKMGLEAATSLGENGEGAIPLVIEGEDVGILIGKHGQTLQAFQYLINLTLNNGVGEGEAGQRVIVDAGNYRARRQSTLEQVAHSVAARARRENRPVRLEPMPAHERRLIHMFLQNEQGLTTASEGREPMRYLVVTPAGAENQRPLSERNGGNGSGRRNFGGYGNRSSGNNRGRGGRR